MPLVLPKFHNLIGRDAITTTTTTTTVALGRTRLMLRDRDEEVPRIGSLLARARRDKAIPGGELCRLQVGIHLHWLARTYVSSSVPPPPPLPRRVGDTHGAHTRLTCTRTQRRATIAFRFIRSFLRSFFRSTLSTFRGPALNARLPMLIAARARTRFAAGSTALAAPTRQALRLDK